MIIGVNINSIEAKTTMGNIKGEISVNSAPNIIDVYKRDIADIKDVIIIKFGFVANYNPDVGIIKMEGEVLYKTKDANNILKDWQEKTQLDSDIAVVVLNAIFKKCLIKAIDLSGELRLPPPVRFPTVAKEKVKE
ncbi:MAG: hypothetical protein V1870_01380 [Candidatus Aenigmatarchaeota archaeon]